MTHCQWVWPLTRAEVSSEATTAACRTRSAMASAAALRAGSARASILAIAPSLIVSPNSSVISRDSRSNEIAWVTWRCTIKALMPGPKGEPGTIPAGTGALKPRRQQGHTPRWRCTRVTTGLVGGAERMRAMRARLRQGVDDPIRLLGQFAIGAGPALALLGRPARGPAG